ncbi:MAG: hypothetical protein KAS17_10085 [Victivallaceae bacterium]|nr:hypothetical protein [Victivallaceae bacterium]
MELADKYYFITPVYFDIRFYSFYGVNIPNDKLKYLKKAYILNNPADMFCNVTMWLPLNTSLNYNLSRSLK